MNRLKSPLGMLLTSTAALLIVSPKAREAARKLVVKGATGVMDLIEQVKAAASNASSLTEPAQLEKEGPSVAADAGQSDKVDYTEFLKLLEQGSLHAQQETDQTYYPDGPDSLEAAKRKIGS